MWFYYFDKASNSNNSFFSNIICGDIYIAINNLFYLEFDTFSSMQLCIQQQNYLLSIFVCLPLNLNLELTSNPDLF